MTFVSSRLWIGLIVLLLWLYGCSAPPHVRMAPDASFTDVYGSAHQPLATPRSVNVFVFITNDCPIANGYAPEINCIVNDYATRGVAFYLVHVDRDLRLSDAMQHAQDFGYQCPVLLDPQHQLVNATGASVTPEAAVIDVDRRLIYLGRIDDQYNDFGKRRFQPSRRDLRQAIDAALVGQSVPNRRTKAVGCYIADS